MNSKLGTLIRFQELNLKIVKLEKRTQRIPEEIEAYRQTLEESRQALLEEKRLIEEHQARQRELEMEVVTLRDTLSKHKTQLMEVKTNKEYQAMLHEIEGGERGIEAKEDQILEGMMVIEEREKVVQEAQTEYEKEEKEILSKQSQLESFAAQAENEIVDLQKERGQLEGEMPEELTQQYQRIASVRNGVALAEAKDQSCQGCHVKLRPQLFTEIRTNREIITCENCSRFLYYAGP
ncbi:MAG: hypothetical protein IH937_08605 [Acidobacteria bacterium]|nr:hypothetical protein [Acidobacteriota bacterium]